MAACRGRLSIGFQMTGGQLQVTIEVACQTDRMQVLTTIGWAARLDACSRRLLTDALRTAAQPDPAARAPLFAALARDLFRHAVHTLPPNPGKRTRRHRAAYSARHGPPAAAIPKAGNETPPLPADLLTAIHTLDTAARLRPRVTLTDSAAIERLMRATLAALHGLFASFGSYLEHALQLLEPHVSRRAVRAFVLETRGEVDELAACHTAGVYLESLTITEAGDKPACVEVEGSLGAAV